MRHSYKGSSLLIETKRANKKNLEAPLTIIRMITTKSDNWIRSTYILWQLRERLANNVK